ncbi:MAG: HAD hydrolase-like protein, partial [bacterium]
MKDSITLVLFDIDGTLLETHGAGRQAFANALRVVFGSDEELKRISFAGATDLDVFRKIMNDKGHTPTPEEEEAFFRRLPVELTQTTSAQRVELFPGVRELLVALSADRRVLLGLVTGNIEECARIK